METNRLARRIRAFRKLKGLTQQELAQRIDISIGILGAMERGSRKVDDVTLQKIADALEVDIDEIRHD